MREAGLTSMSMSLSLALLSVLCLAFVAACSGGEASATLTEQQFRALLTVDDLAEVLASDGPLTQELSDFKAMAESVDPAQVAVMDSWFGSQFATQDGSKAMTFTVIDFDSGTAAESHYSKVKMETGPPRLSATDRPIGDESVQAVLDSRGLGSVLVFLKADRVVTFHTAVLDGDDPMTGLDGLAKLAATVDKRLD